MKRNLQSILVTGLVCIWMLGLSIPAMAADANSKAGAVTTQSGYLNVRSSPSASSTKLTSLRKGSYITLLSKSGDWWKVEYGKGKYGYCHGDYITVVQGSPTTVTTAGGNLNVRSGPGTTYPKADSLYNGEAVLLLSRTGEWARVLYHGTKTGYVSAKYLSGGYGAVTLHVPGFKQTDSRWRDVQIGQSGKTMAQIGCATTAIAMMESARTGNTITPDVMASKLRYTPTGSVYWPENYTVVSRESGLLSGIYSLLQQGKPVLFGGRNAYGKQHWVVIYGFSGGKQLDAAGFRIHDPGSVSRVNLQQFMNEYPTFYKYFHY